MRPFTADILKFTKKDRLKNAGLPIVVLLRGKFFYLVLSYILEYLLLTTIEITNFSIVIKILRAFTNLS